MIVAARRNGDGFLDVEIAEKTRSKSAAEMRIRSNKIGMALFISVPESFGEAFCLKAFLSRFLD